MISNVGPLQYLAILATSAVVSSSDILDVCISGVESNVCKDPAFYGPYRNEKLLFVRTDKQNVDITDLNTGKEPLALRLPGDYRIHLGQVIFYDQLDFLAGDLRIEIDVPQIGRINAFPTCDENSHPVNVNSEQYCRYCDLCSIIQNVEDDLRSNQLITEIDEAADVCKNIKPNRIYNLTRTVRLKGPSSFDLRNIESNVNSAFELGTGRMIVKMRLLSKQVYSHESCKRKCMADPSERPCDRCSKAGHCITKCNTNQRGTPVQNSMARQQCRRSSGYMPDYRMATCFNAEFHYYASMHSDGSRRPRCEDSNKASRCYLPGTSRLAPRYCCGCSNSECPNRCPQECVGLSSGTCNTLYA